MHPSSSNPLRCSRVTVAASRKQLPVHLAYHWAVVLVFGGKPDMRSFGSLAINILLTIAKIAKWYFSIQLSLLYLHMSALSFIVLYNDTLYKTFPFLFLCYYFELNWVEISPFVLIIKFLKNCSAKVEITCK